MTKPQKIQPTTTMQRAEHLVTLAEITLKYCQECEEVAMTASERAREVLRVARNSLEILRWTSCSRP